MSQPGGEQKNGSDGREGQRKTARDVTQEPVKKTATDGTQRPMKRRVVPTAGKDVDTRWQSEDWSATERRQQLPKEHREGRTDERFRKELEELLADRESGPRQESENFDGQVKEAQCEVGVR